MWKFRRFRSVFTAVNWIAVSTANETVKEIFLNSVEGIPCYDSDEAMLDAFRTGQDVHARTASEIFEVPLSEVDSTLRSRAKAVNFGIIYGISGFGLARNTGVSQQEAKSFISRYFAKYPGVKRFMDTAVEDGQQNGYGRTEHVQR